MWFRRGWSRKVARDYSSVAWKKAATTSPKRRIHIDFCRKMASKAIATKKLDAQNSTEFGNVRSAIDFGDIFPQSRATPVQLNKIHNFPYLFNSTFSSILFSLAFRLTPIISPGKPSSCLFAFEYIPNFAAHKINWIYANTQHIFRWPWPVAPFDKYFVHRISGELTSKRLSFAVHDFRHVSEATPRRELGSNSSVHAEECSCCFGDAVSRMHPFCVESSCAMNRMANDVI